MSDANATKRCSKCQAEKPRSEFFPRRRSTDGLQSRCKACNRQTAADWNRNNPATGRAWRQDNRPRELATSAKWKQANPEKVRAYGAKYARANPDKMRQKLARRRAIQRRTTVDPKNIAAFYRMVREANRLRCYWCNRLVAKADRQVDHIVPLARGGPHTVLNLCCSCASCNHRKRHKLPAEFTGQHELFAQGTAP